MKKLILLILVVVAVVGVGKYLKREDKNIVVVGREYILTNSGETPITIGFDAEKFYGFSGINRYFGTYTIEGKKIKFSHPGMTMMAGPQELMVKEQEYMKKLETVNEFELRGKKLILGSNGKNILKYKETVLAN